MIQRLVVLLLLCATPTAAQVSKTHLISNLPLGVAFEIAPDGRIFTTQKGNSQTVPSQIQVFDADGNFLSVFYDLSDSTNTGGERGLLGITLDPDFSSNHYVYAFYNYNDSAMTNVLAGDDRVRVQRFTEVAGVGTQPTLILDLDVSDSISVFHTGGNIHFRPSDSTHLYVTLGDMGTGYTSDMPARVDNPLGKMLRISKYPGAAPPSDNPFYDDGNPYTGNCDYIWAYGLRNSFDFCFGPNDSLYATENGTWTYDEVNLIARGGFYGWPHCEGTADGDTLSLPCHEPAAIAPLFQFPNPLPALTGIIFYTDTVFSAQQDHLITGDFNHADLFVYTLSNAPAYDVIDSAVFWIDESMINGITCLRQGPQGCIYVMELGDSIYGGVYMICPDATGTPELSNGPSLSVQGANPFRDETTLSYFVPAATQICCTVYDSFGRVVTVLADGQQAAGTHHLTINARALNLSPGMYTCVLQHANGSSAQRLIVE